MDNLLLASTTCKLRPKVGFAARSVHSVHLCVDEAAGVPVFVEQTRCLYLQKEWVAQARTADPNHGRTFILDRSS
jgi:hypothetical protein